MATMKAVGLTRYLPIENPESLVDVVVEKPRATGRDILVKVIAISVNPVDTKVRAPKDRVEEVPKILGWDVAGIVEEAGPDCSLFRPGDEVFYAGSIARQGGNSEYHLVDERIVGRKPTSLNFAEAAALPLTSITAWEALFTRMSISQDSGANQEKSLLIIGAAGGVGSIAIQLAKQAGLIVIGTASRPETVDWVKSMGADYIINHHDTLLPQLEAIGFSSVPYIFCLNALEKHWAGISEVVSPQGVVCAIDDPTSPLNLKLLKQKSATFVWEFMFTRSLYETDDMIEQHLLLNLIADAVDHQKLKTTLAEVLGPISAEHLRQAHKLLESNRTIGKVVLENFV
ncbi:zinc-binding alcohol dehydrogenase family protein [Paenibacillus alginolyticus]|uniref:Zinc-type alcohol dehydrogenase-like protein n=3 Tax=Paenibacillaceae TaxID=186822 RepID=A0ABT4G5G3_9BACL|nr:MULTISPECIES: zinc-binding alcohol dehydrogenase family protein [Paenibacillus]MCY9665354.1 zinc-binding alcohol dehydrogenase family protein [Paenibacillus alginolyticus]MCY9691424.1 zinc-binding alcohol dehydrogenase family protein [Paenibacillus alginolyticus]MEC0146532.1 zinc-binding alcohol dehydrogenase family protein [Paenibacillus alginolyticus]